MGKACQSAEGCECGGVLEWKRIARQPSRGGGRDEMGGGRGVSGMGSSLLTRHVDNPSVTVEPDREMLYKVPPAPRGLVGVCAPCTDVKGCPDLWYLAGTGAGCLVACLARQVFGRVCLASLPRQNHARVPDLLCGKARDAELEVHTDPNWLPWKCKGKNLV